MKVCGLTGGVGMGKSTAARFLRERGARIVDTDELARQLVQPGQPALMEIQTVFGRSVVAPDGRLRRDELAQIVFTDPAARTKLEAILHPRIRERWLAQIETWRAAPKQSDGGRVAPKRPAATVREHGGSDGGRGKNHPPAVVVIPLLFETKAESHFDKIICAACSSATQRERLLARGWTPEQIQQRLAAQWPVGQKIARADFVIWTDGALEAHAQQIERVLQKL
jgi:dephospho-CoA kinase